MQTFEESTQADLACQGYSDANARDNGRQVFERMQIEMLPRFQRFDMDFDLSDAFLPEFPPAIFLPELWTFLAAGSFPLNALPQNRESPIKSFTLRDIRKARSAYMTDAA